MNSSYFYNKAGLTRYYAPPFLLQAPIPRIGSLVENPKQHIVFIEHVTLNHKGLNWKCFRYKLTSKNYKSFIYAFAYAMAIINPSHSVAWNINSNAKRLKKALNRKHIELTEAENNVLSICLNFNKWDAIYRDRIAMAISLQLDLAQQYGVRSKHYLG